MPTATTEPASRFRPLAAAMPGGRLLTSPSHLAAYSSDGLGYKTFMPDAVTIPANASELVALFLFQGQKSPRDASMNA